MKSHIAAANTPAQIDVPVGQSRSIVGANESKVRLKRGRPVGANDIVPQKRKNLANVLTKVGASEEATPTREIDAPKDVIPRKEIGAPEEDILTKQAIKTTDHKSPEEALEVINNEVSINYGCPEGI